MKKIALFLTYLFFMSTFSFAQVEVGEIVEMDQGYPGYTWFYYIPPGLDKTKMNYILVAGMQANVDEEYEGAIEETYNSCMYNTSWSNRYNFILLTPVIPRALDYNKNGKLTPYYAVSMCRYIFYDETPEFYKRPDLKVNDMIDDLQELLRQDGYIVNDKVMMEGFSAGGGFTMRYTVLNPERIEACGVGSGGEFFLPTDTYDNPESSWNGVELPWMMGPSDFEELTDKVFAKSLYLEVPQYVYGGELENDPEVAVVTQTPMEEGGEWLTQFDIDFMRENFGDDDAETQRNMVAYAIQHGSNITFKQYPEVGHWVTDDIRRDVLEFLSSHKKNVDPTTEIFVNGNNDNYKILYGNDIYVTISLYADKTIGQNADWWILSSDGKKNYSFVEGEGWKLGEIPFRQGPIEDIELLHITKSPLPLGTYEYTFSLDDNMDGVRDNTWSHSVSFDVVDLFPKDIPLASIEVDGNSDDWIGIPPVYQDPSGDSKCGTGSDIKNLYLAHDSANVYWRVDTHSGIYGIGDVYDSIVFMLGDNKSKAVHESMHSFGSYVGYLANEIWNDYVGGGDIAVFDEIAEGKIPLSAFPESKYQYAQAYFFNDPPNESTCDIIHLGLDEIDYSSPGNVLSGKVLYDGKPVNAMVLTNGKYTFSDKNTGHFAIQDIPLDKNGQMTIQIFCSGLAPQKVIFTPTNVATTKNIDMIKEDRPDMSFLNVSCEKISNNKARLTGQVRFNDTPVTAMVLANGQYMFTKNEQASFNLDVPLNSEGKVTLMGFCANLAPYRQVLTPQ